MSLLIDGYNVLHAVGLLRAGGGVGPGTLERARGALLGLLAGTLSAEELGRTTVAFDAHDAPSGAPTTVRHRGITVRFAVGYPDADTLIEELIRTDSAPMRLTVVSSDHRIRRAARRRGAISVDSETWHEQLLLRRRGAGQGGGKSSDESPAASAESLPAEEVDYWVARFGGEQGPDGTADAEPGLAANAPTVAPDRAPDEKPVDEKPLPGEQDDFDDLFPPGYGEDLLADSPDGLWDTE